ncbi:Gfo/Idh/MocA family oxidoreductase [Octadecabacter sp. 1_MG-2023]|uniref:Gfo/Idh/MocA family protein n=1 Tax=unclassified Octadecabacter TaxID=196158 RepID=UPI001C08D9F2|nr:MULTISPECIES: Gfo/Idh/MocA family oxidoreductase [unclassified Octadecabacter]MBU2994788.1 Gfo/Idh/MocA family oxidoreductase [Octadecabacter sp. B2R22]MDO6733918.1 Gfo/Idh/MocA family oxidoreductase [Octadecabacter sp. 1_MG-2023]
MTKTLGVGIIGCGNISTAYLDLASMFKGYEIVAVADINMDNANAQATKFDVRAETVEGLLAARDVDLIINLTIPAAHVEVSSAILKAGKHVYSEKPFVLSLAEAQELGELAKAKGVRIGSAPDTFMGGSHQLARNLIDAGTIGNVASGAAVVMSSGMEDWHPNPDFFFQKGGGPILDLGPYYICNLVQLLGPVKQVTSFTGMASDTRTIGNGPRNGETVPVETPTTIHSVLSFENGAIITLLASWDVVASNHPIMELYGTEGTMNLPDPNFFGGELTITERGADPVEKSWDHPFNVPNFEETKANYRGAGLADMALAIGEGRPHRCNDDFATHVVEVMTAILEAGETGTVMTMTTTCERPDVLGPDAARALLA